MTQKGALSMGKKENDFLVKRIDDFSLKGTFFEAKKPKAVMIIVHGMAEHRKRYYSFAEFLNKKSISVYLYDQRGHGESILEGEVPGFFGDLKGWALVVSDLLQVVEQVKSENNNLPLVLLGHSMGSFVVRSFLIDYSDLVDAAIFSGTSGLHPFPLKIANCLARIVVKSRGIQEYSPFLEKIALGSNNRKCKPARTKFDWLSTEESVVDNYNEDPLCGFNCPTSFYRDLFEGLAFVNKKKNFSQMRKDLPLYLVSGDKDPVGGYGKGVKTLYQKWVDAGMEKVEIKLYENGRHEILNEIFKNEVYEDIVKWVDKTLQKK